MRPLLKSMFKGPYILFNSLLFDPLALINKWRAIPYFVCNLLRYQRLSRINHNLTFQFRLKDMFYASSDRFATSGTTKGHYFLQDLWAAQYLFENGVRKHFDVGSRIDGFIAHILPFCLVYYVDIRSPNGEVKRLKFIQGSILSLPFAENSISSLSCLHVIEHIGLGRYGDFVDPDGYLKAAGELTRVLAPGGKLLLSAPVGRQRLCFDAHRIFDPQTIVNAFKGLSLAYFALIDDVGDKIKVNSTFEDAKKCYYGCGLFIFTK